MRFCLALLGGVVTAFGLFLLMQRLIDPGIASGARREQGAMVDFVRLRPDEQVARKQRVRPDAPPPPARRPPPPRLTINRTSRPEPVRLDIVVPAIRLPVSVGSGPYIGAFSAGPVATEGDVVPIVRIAPRYPREARMRGTEGWVRVRFTIKEDGTVDNAAVVEAEPRRIFNREAVRAILRWKFKPRIVDGVAVAREAEQIIEFTMEGD